MFRYLRIYKLLLYLNFLLLVEYRANFIGSLISSIVWGALSIFSMYLLVFRISSVYGWSKYEMLVLTGVYNIFWGTFHMFFTKNFERFSTIIHFGQLDNILLKPVDSQFLLSFWFINYTNVIRIMFSIIFTIYILIKMQVIISLINIVGFVLFLVIGFILMFSIWFLFMTITIWLTRLSNILDLMFSISGLARYPDQMFRKAGIFIFIFAFPITLVIMTPVKILLQKAQLLDIIAALLFSIILLFLSRVFWKFALRSYTSAGG